MSVLDGVDFVFFSSIAAQNAEWISGGVYFSGLGFMNLLRFFSGFLPERRRDLCCKRGQDNRKRNTFAIAPQKGILL